MGKEITANEEFDYKAKAIEWLQSNGIKLPANQNALFMELCVAYKLNPFKREIYVVGYKEKYNIITGYEVYLKRAERTGNLNGWTCVTNENNTKAKITIHRKDWQYAFEHEVLMSEVRQNSPIWSKMPIFMMKKVCIEQGFRLCFPDEMGGMPYGEEEVSFDRVIQPEAKETIAEPEKKAATIPENNSDREELKKILETYENDLSGVPYDLSCEALAENDPAKITEMVGRCKTYLGKKGIKVA